MPGFYQYTSRELKIPTESPNRISFVDFLILQLYVRLLIFLSFFLSVPECLYHCLATLWLIVCAYTSIHPVSYSLSFWISVLVFGYIVTHCTCICTSLCCATLSLIVGVYFHLLIRVSLSFSLNTSISVRLYCHWLYMNRYVSWSAFLSLSVCLSQCPVYYR